MTTNRKFYRHVFKIVVLNEHEHYAPNLEDLSYDIDQGESVGEFDLDEESELTPQAFIAEVYALGSEPEFFWLDADGNDLYD